MCRVFCELVASASLGSVVFGDSMNHLQIASIADSAPDIAILVFLVSVVKTAVEHD